MTKATWIKRTTARDDEAGKTVRDYVKINGITLVRVNHPYGGCINIDGQKGIVGARDNGKVYHSNRWIGQETELDLPANYLDLIKKAIATHKA